MIPQWMLNPLRLKNRFSVIPFALAAALSLASTARAANIVADPGFESVGANAGSTVFAGSYLESSNAWLVTAGSVYIDTNDPWVYAGNNSLNLTYSNDYATDSVQQTLATTAGQLYTISFYANADSPNSFSVTENGLAIAGMPGSIVDNGFPNNTNSGLFVDYTGTFVANSSSTVLQFSAQADPPNVFGYTGGDSVMIDNVSVFTPEPSSMVLTFTGLAGLGFAFGRKRLAATI
jgi:hypothetical protein